MANTNFKLFDENKTNMMSDEEYATYIQRLNGVQTGIANSKLQNKSMYQCSLIAYAISQIMVNNGYNAVDTDAAATFVNNLTNSILGKVTDSATPEQVLAGVEKKKWISPFALKEGVIDDINYALWHTFTIGDILLSVNDSINDTWLKCDGSPVSQADYPELYQKLLSSFSSTWVDKTPTDAVCADSSGNLFGTNGTELLKSTDGGKTWVSVSPLPSTIYHYSIACNNDASVICIYGTSSSSGQSTRLFVGSSSGGFSQKTISGVTSSTSSRKVMYTGDGWVFFRGYTDSDDASNSWVYYGTDINGSFSTNKFGTGKSFLDATYNSGTYYVYVVDSGVANSSRASDVLRTTDISLSTFESIKRLPGTYTHSIGVFSINSAGNLVMHSKDVSSSSGLDKTALYFEYNGQTWENKFTGTCSTSFYPYAFSSTQFSDFSDAVLMNNGTLYKIKNNSTSTENTGDSSSNILISTKTSLFTKTKFSNRVPVTPSVVVNNCTAFIKAKYEDGKR